jgi:hypothetical protein
MSARRDRLLGALGLAALVAGALAVAPLLDDPRRPEAVETPSRPSVSRLPAGPPPRLPYTVSDPATGGMILYDELTRVSLPPGGGVSVVARVPDGWFVQRPEDRGVRRTEAGVLDRRGGFRAFGATRSDSPVTLSPDGKRVAFAADDDGARHLVVADVRTGTRSAALHEPEADLVGWNAEGIWVRSGTGRTRLWRPGTTPVVIPGAEALQVTRTTARMLDVRDGCTAVVTLTAQHRLRTVWRDCVDAVTLSPDGAAVVLADGSVHRLADGHVTRIRPPATPGDQAWEDAYHVLLWETRTDGSTTRETVVRCDIRTGRCERAHDTERPGSGTRLVLGRR